MRDGDDLPPRLLDRLIRAYLRMRGRPDRPELPPPPDLDAPVDTSPATPVERAAAEAAAREAMRRLRQDPN
ncbi:hypothetical protein [Longimicrobium sp.]|jgi:hypothetical protein|uniref:hypothetical protein n=1 Tax=Longimicrobium sp. TaxID=2029185 RepID=UPI002EDB42C2